MVCLRYGIFPSALETARALARDGQDAPAILRVLLQRRGRLDGVTVSLIMELGAMRFAADLIEDLDAGAALAHDLRRAVSDLVDEATAADFALTGAEAVALALRQAGVGWVFAYAGTSELALCDKLARLPDMQLVNGRGDRESAFLAGGASLLRPGTAAALLHGARGGLNAAGAISELHRTEVGVPVVVGLPSTGSAPYLPPHGEPGLLGALGAFAAYWYECGGVPDGDADRRAAARDVIDALQTMLRRSRTRPLGPTLFGLPQDAAEKPWIPWSALASTLDIGPPDATAAPRGHARPAPANLVAAVDRLAGALARAQRPVILIDDYLLAYSRGRSVLQRLSAALAAPVLQVRYCRGPMLFDRVSRADVPNFVGPYDPLDRRHAAIMERADFLITLEDRNLYPRVVGALPACRKAAITSSAGKVRKNGYLGPDDILVEGDVVEAVEQLLGRLTVPGWPAGNGRGRWWTDLVDPAGPRADLPEPVRALREGLADGLAAALCQADRPVLIDDSQMFGGLLSDQYDRLPASLRVVGAHGGFVGWGLSAAAGLAIAQPDATVVCTLGDEGFVNAVQGLVAVGQQAAAVTYLVCNNGGSVSLRKQALADDEWALDRGCHSYLRNASGASYAAIAAAAGLRTTTVDWQFDRGVEAIRAASTRYRSALVDAVHARRPALVELVLPAEPAAWEGVWATAGNEVASAEPAGVPR